MSGYVTLPPIADDDPDRAAEDGPVAAPGAGGAQDRPVLRVRGRRPRPAHGRLCPGGPLAGLHLVRHRVCGAVRPEGAHWLAGQPGQRHGPALQSQQHRRAIN